MAGRMKDDKKSVARLKFCILRKDEYEEQEQFLIDENRQKVISAKSNCEYSINVQHFFMLVLASGRGDSMANGNWFCSLLVCPPLHTANRIPGRNSTARHS